MNQAASTSPVARGRRRGLGSAPTPLRARTLGPTRIAHLALLALLAALLAACGASAAPVRQEQTVDGITIGFEAAESPRMNVSQELIVTLADAQGAPVDGAAVYLDLTMPAMPMGANQPIAEPLGGGRYRAPNVVYTMTGEHEITVVATVDGAEHRAVFTRTAVQ